MTPFRIIHVSDTHLGQAHPWITANFEAMADIIARQRPDLVINMGDVAFDGAGSDADLAFARARHAALRSEVRVIPGNHDLGDNPWRGHDAETITAARRDRYRQHFGEDYWRIDVDRWMLVGLNAQLFGSGLPDEDEQWSFLANAAADAGDRLVALFIHKPLFKDAPGESDVNHRYVVPAHRRRLMAALADVDVRLVASGHVHQHRRHRPGGAKQARTALPHAEHCWGPSAAFILPDRIQPVIGTKRATSAMISIAAALRSRPSSLTRWSITTSPLSSTCSRGASQAPAYAGQRCADPRPPPGDR